MYRQVNYIIYAFLFLILIVSGYWLAQKILIPKLKKIDLVGTMPEKPSIGLSSNAAKGKTLFMNRCASCHAIFRDATGPGLIGFEERGPWIEKKNIYEWVRNPSAFMKKNQYVRELEKVYNSMMTGFPDLANEEIDAICTYISEAEKIDYSIPVAKK